MAVLVRYVIAGTSAVAIHFLMMITLVETIAAPPVLASFVGFCCGSLLNYGLQYHWIFSSDRNHRSALMRYLIVTSLMMLVNLGLFDLIHASLGADYRLAQLFATGIVFVGNFCVNATFTFKRDVGAVKPA